MISSEPFVDSHTLMTALFDPQSRSQALLNFVCESDQFKEINSNDMVREILVSFLRADIAFRKVVTEYLKLPWIARTNRWSKTRRQYGERLGVLRKELTDAHTELEMIRKLAMPDNSLLMHKPYEFMTSK